MRYYVLLFMLLLAACSTEVNEFELDKVMAVLNDQEIKARDILTQYPLDDEYIEIFLKEEVIISEAKALGIRVSEEEVLAQSQTVFPGLEPVEIYQLLDEKDFYISQAKLLGVTPEEYYGLWADSYYARELYIQKYIGKMFEEPTTIEEGALWGEQIEEHINERFSHYVASGQLIRHD